MQLVQETDLKKAIEHLGYGAVINAMAEAFISYSKGQCEVAPVQHLQFNGEESGDFCVKSGFVKGGGHMVVKIAGGGFPGYGSSGLMAVFSQTTGVLDGILLDNGWLTDLRTAAAGALFAKHLAPKDVSAIGVLGTGVQARFQLLLLKEVTECRRVVLWGRRQEGRDSCAADLAKLGYDVTTTESVGDVTAQCNLIVTVTSSTEALIKEEHALLPGTHINAFGSDGVGKQELDASVLARADLVVADSLEQCCAFGEVSHAVAANVPGVKEKLLEAG
eukprot:gene13633-6802_t